MRNAEGTRRKPFVVVLNSRRALRRGMPEFGGGTSGQEHGVPGPALINCVGNCGGMALR
ncbi:MAG: hypothetical protein ACLR23_15465 [Clostridia bacterium]